MDRLPITIPLLVPEVPLSQNGPLRTEPFRRTVSLNWKEIAAIGGVAVSVAGLAASLFSGLMWAYTAAFAVLTLTSLLHWKMVRNHAEWGHFTAASRQLEASHVQLQASEQQLQTSLNQMQRDQENLNRIITALRSENENLHRINQEIRQTNQNLETTNQSLQRTEQILREEKTHLETQIHLFESNNQLLRGQNQEMETRNNQMSRQMDSMQSSIIEMNSLESILSRSTGAIRQGVDDLHRLIGFQEQVTEMSIAYSKQFSGGLRNPLRRLSLSIAEMQKLHHLVANDDDQKSDADLSPRLEKLSREIEEERALLAEIAKEEG